MIHKLFVATKAFIIYRKKVLIVRESTKYKDGTNFGSYDVPGGRIKPGQKFDKSLLREIKEETGLKEFKIIDPYKPFDVDIHLIPKRPEFPEHFHYDVRFLLEANPNDLIHVSEESHDVQWIRLDDLEEFSQERSVLRMKEKLF